MNIKSMRMNEIIMNIISLFLIVTYFSLSIFYLCNGEMFAFVMLALTTALFFGSFLLEMKNRKYEDNKQLDV